MPHDFATLFETHRARVYRWALTMCGRHEDALDVVQDVFLRMLQRPPSLDGAHSPLAWLRRVTTRVVIDRWRARRPQPPSAELPEPITAPRPELERREEAELLRNALRTISDQQRLVLICKICDEMTFQQIAHEIGIAVPTAKTHYIRGLSAIRERMQSSNPAGRWS